MKPVRWKNTFVCVFRLMSSDLEEEVENLHEEVEHLHEEAERLHLQLQYLKSQLARREQTIEELKSELIMKDSIIRVTINRLSELEKK